MTKYKVTFAINIVGLSTGLACAMLIFLWVHDEWRIDKFHLRDKQLYQVMEVKTINNEINVYPNTQGLLAESMAKDLPEVEKASCFVSLVEKDFLVHLKTDDQRVVKAGAVWADKDFFKMFSYHLINGDANQIFNNKNAVVITKSLAKSLYGNEEGVIGKSFECDFLGKKNIAQVTGVMDDIPEHSTHKFDFVMTKESLFELFPFNKEWYNEGTNTFLQLRPNTDITAFNTKIKDYVNKYNKANKFSIFVRPYSDAYLYGSYFNGVQSGGRIMYVRLFSIIAFFIILIACINFMNLSTAKATRRQKEVGIRKTMGSSRSALIIQFLTESILMSLFSFVCALGVVDMMLPIFNQITGKHLGLHFDVGIASLLVAATIVTGLISGSYPALYLSGFNAIATLKGKVKSTSGVLFARQGLVVFQFVVSLLLIIATVVIYQQMQMIQSMNLGYNKDNVVYFDNEGTIHDNTASFLNKIKEIPSVIKASLVNGGIATNLNNATTYDVQWQGKSKEENPNFMIHNVDFDLIEALDIQVKEGRSFSKTYGAEVNNMIFNETGIKTMGIKNPIGSRIRMWGKDYTIIGVVKDFHANSIHEVIPPMLFRYAPKETSQVLVKIAAGKEKETMSKLESIYAEYNVGYPFNYKFLDDQYQLLYQTEKRVSILSKYFAVLSILISCLGLFGLATFNAEVRAKEIGIRKVLGASVSNVAALLSKDFLLLVMVAIVVASPIAYYFMHRWLQNFAYHITISWWIFALAGLITLLIAFLTVSFQAIKAAVANPVKSLRSE